MLIKLGIIVGVMVLGGMILFNEADNLSPTSAATFDSLQNDAHVFGSDLSNSVGQGIDSSIDTIVDQSESLPGQVNDAQGKITSTISETIESSQKMIEKGFSGFNPMESIQNIFNGNPNLESTSQPTTDQ